jgi:uncharacterized repeat protein (TIGR03803 family)
LAEVLLNLHELFNTGRKGLVARGESDDRQAAALLDVQFFAFDRSSSACFSDFNRAIMLSPLVVPDSLFRAPFPRSQRFHSEDSMQHSLAQISPFTKSQSSLTALKVFARALLLVCMSATAAFAQTFSVIHNFNPNVDGSEPMGNLVEDSVSNWYGTLSAGTGATNFGGVYQFDPSGTVSILAGFAPGSVAAYPRSGLFRDTDGTFYGVTYGGGDTTCQCGTIYKLDTSGDVTILHKFLGGADGAFPITQLISINGALYGTTSFNGVGNVFGVLFKVTKGGEYTVLHQFTQGMPEGDIPNDLTRDAAGNIYGSTAFGGATGSNQGTVYKIDTTGTLTVLHTFSGGQDGGEPVGRLIVDVNGNIRGTTEQGGNRICKCGVVFRINAAGDFHVLHTFNTLRDGQFPNTGVIDVGGSIYGVTGAGGFTNCTGGCGTVYKISNTGVYSVLERFNKTDGQAPNRIALGSDGNLYGTTLLGGTNQAGTFFKIIP